jgi:hypothetical protein
MLGSFDDAAQGRNFSSRRATTPLAAIMKSSINSVARFFSCFATPTPAG